MECCELTLEDLIGRLPQHRLSEEQAFPLAKQLLLGLLHLKDKDIIHRDLKPPNILLRRIANPNGSLTTTFHNSPADIYQVKIADLNLSRYLPDQTLTKTTVGTPLVMV
jgi:serine/threonine protein kinase